MINNDDIHEAASKITVNDPMINISSPESASRTGTNGDVKNDALLNAFSQLSSDNDNHDENDQKLDKV